MENKLSFKKVFLTAFILMMIAGLSGAAIVLLNMVTEPIIAQNEIKVENEKLNEVYSNAIFVDLKITDGNILKVCEAQDEEQNTIGYVYKASGKNAYGSITLIVGINLDGTVRKAVLMQNTESFASTVNDHFEENYRQNDLTEQNINDIDVKCGATYGAKLIKELINDALIHFNEHYIMGGEE